MKQYKHKPTGKIAEKCIATYIVEGRSIPAYLIENSCDWEEIKEEKKPEYTILSFVNSFGKLFEYDKINDWYSNRDRKDLNARFICYQLSSAIDNLTINSVRRESDGEVFTVGDKLKSVTGIDMVINQFKILSRSDDTICCVTENNITILIDSWRKVKKEWEITAFRLKRHSHTWDGLWKLENGYYHSPNNTANNTADKFLKQEYFEIYSVKRISDGIEFKIGDTFYLNSTNAKLRIASISIEHTEVWFNGNFINMKYCRKAEKIFTTEDGVDIYEGDDIWRINGLYDVLTPMKASDVHKDWNEKWFSSKKAAKEYILMNKPCISLYEIKRIGICNEHHWEYFTDIVEFKIKNGN